MNKPRFLELVRDPDKLEFFDLEKLEEVVANFPYFQAAHLLIAKLAKAESSMFAAEKLNMAAVCTLDRKKLKKWMQTKPHRLTVFVNNNADSELSKVNETNTDINQSTIATVDTTSELNEAKEQIIVEADGTQSILQQEVKVQAVAEEDTEQSISQEEIKELIIEEEDTEQSSLQEEIKEQTVAEEDSEQSSLQEEIIEQKAKEEVFLKENVSEEYTNTDIKTDTVVELPVAVPDIYQNDIKVDFSESDSKLPEDKAHSLANPLESIEESTIAGKQDFYAELENNLKILRQNKEAAKRNQEQKIEVATEESQSPITTPSVAEVVVEKLYIENTNATVEDSRLEEILRKDIENKNKFSEKDLLIEYFNYLSQRRVARLNDKKSVNNLIDKFITNEPTIPKLKPSAVKVPLIDLSEKSTKPVTKIVSENFAKILASQGKLDKAIEMYEALGLKNPEKKAYFANLILELKNKNTNQ